MKILSTHEINKTVVNQLIQANLATATAIHKSRGKTWGSEAKAFSFIVSCLEMFYGNKIPKQTLSKIITDGHRDNSLDVIRVNSDGTIDIFDIKNDNSLSTSDLSFLKYSIKVNVLEKPNDYSIFNSIAIQRIKEIHMTEKPVIRVFIVRNTGAKATTYFNKMKSELKTFSKVKSVELVVVDDLIRKKMENESYKGDWAIQTNEDCLHRFERSKELTLKIPLEKIVELHNISIKDGTNLFNRNIRTFLKKKELSEGIVETLSKEPNNFYYYHNGITLVAKSITLDSPFGFTVKDPQVINGAQTINSISAAFADSKIRSSDIKDAHVLCKIYVANDDETEKICETSNTQVKVDNSDLRSNDEVQMILELLINNFPKTSFEYARKKPYKVKDRKNDLITLPEFTQWVYSVVFEKPASAKNDKRLLFDATKKGLYRKIYINGNGISDDSTIKRICEIGVFVRRMIKEETDKEVKGILRSANLHLMAGLYIRSSNLNKTNFNKLSKLVQGYVKNEQRINPGISSIRIFSSSEEPWKHIKTNYK
ncbi:MAG TPA: AIPR family protein [Candidatus Paceibacterota bacterium]|nr:AIPR family protein [Candidatus Paceibacterota bacterium]HMO83010.1 AIPR family protein [Candidatus Paceibacterota bacterium]